MLSKNQIRDLQKQWEVHPALSLRQILASSDQESPFGRTEAGLMDFRGFAINESLHKLTLEQLDLSFCVLLGRGQFASTVRKCCFVGATMEGTHSKSFDLCDFSGADLRNSVMLGTFTNCQFTGANLSMVRSRQAIFTGCCFDKANLRSSAFYWCQFTDCSFIGTKFVSGSLAHSLFTNCRFDHPDFSRAVLDGTKGI